MDRRKNATRTDFDLLNRLASLSFLSTRALHELESRLNSTDWRRGAVIVPEEELTAGVYILLRGVAKMTCLNPDGRRVTIAFLAPGPILQSLTHPSSRWRFQCEARTDCRVGRVNWDQFDFITREIPRSDLRKFHENSLMQWYRYRFFGGSLDLRKRILFVLLQLCSTFGVNESRGTLLRVFLSHEDLAGLAGATRSRVTEKLAEFEREHLLIRQGRRQMIVRLDKIEKSISVPPRNTNASFVKVGTGPHLPNVGPFYRPRLSGRPFEAAKRPSTSPI
jgi:CRP-like cAMP-binding protein